MADVEPKMLTLEFIDDVAVKSAYATNVVVQMTEHEYTLTFFEARPKLGVSPGSERDGLVGLTSLKPGDKVPAVAVARVVIAANRMPLIVRLLSDQIRRVEEAVKKSQAQ